MYKKTVVPRTQSPKGWGGRLTTLLRRAGMTQKDLARRVGVSPMAVSKWTAGGGIADEKLDEVCQVLSASHAWLRWGEDAFSDEIWEESSEVGNLMLRSLTNGSRLDMSTVAEAYLGFVMWTFDCETRFWHWSSNAAKLFGLDRVDAVTKVPLNILLDEQIERREDLEVVWRLFGDLRKGVRRSGWGRFTLKHVPGREFLYMARSVQASGSAVRIVGITATSSGLVGQLAIRSGGRRNCYE